ncbi:MAG: hypothetical protein JNK60_12795 [Acidobacteria bacterium]|nr:hypothetical protein [Acidobacteriota bacterium]
MLTVLLPKGAVFQDTVPAGACSSDCGGTVRCELGDPSGWQSKEIVLRSTLGTESTRKVAAGVVSMEQETGFDNNTASRSDGSVVTAVSPSCVATRVYPVSFQQTPQQPYVATPAANLRICGVGFPGTVPPPDVKIHGFPAAFVSWTPASILVQPGPGPVSLGAFPASSGSISIEHAGVKLADTELSSVTYFRRGDVNNTGLYEQGTEAAPQPPHPDSYYLNQYIFLGGPPPVIPCSGDVNGNGQVTAGDAFYLNLWLNNGGAAPLESTATPPECSSIPGSRRLGQQLASVVGPRDAIAVDHVESPRGSTANVPIRLLNVTGSRLSPASDATRMQSVALRLTFPAGRVTGGSIALSGGCAGLRAVQSLSRVTGTSAVFMAQFDPRSSRLPVQTRAESATGDECVTLRLDIAREAERGLLPIHIEPGPWTSLASYDGRMEALASDDGGLRLQDGSVTIK